MDVPLSRLSREELDSLTDTMSDAEISRLYGYTRTAATYVRKRLGVLSFAQKHGARKYARHYTVRPGQKRVFSHRRSGANERFFSVIDTPSKAYWLGFFLADAWIITEKGEPTGYAIALHERDREALEELQSELNGTDMIRRTRPGSSMLQIKLTSSIAAQDLIQHGVVPRKSKTAALPLVSTDLRPHLLRGYFDGDGSISLRNNSLTMDLTSGSKDLLLQILDAVHVELGFRPTLQNDRESFKLRFYAANAIRFGCYLYGDPMFKLFSLTRKRNKFFEYLGSDAGRSWRRLLSDLDSASSR